LSAQSEAGRATKTPSRPIEYLAGKRAQIVPPSARVFCPMIWRASSLTSKSTTSTRSAGRPHQAEAAI
jgi:hypothetical protein